MKIGVLGSINTDIVYEVSAPPQKGETVFGSSYSMLPGGKGANQAIMMSALGVDIAFLGAVGEDQFGHHAIHVFQSKKISTETIHTNSLPSGIAIIELTNNDNSIVVIPGANQSITSSQVEDFFTKHPNINGVVAQFETNLDSVECFLQTAHEKHIPTILNPAPAHQIDSSWMEFVDIIIPNEHEAQLIFGTSSLEEIVSTYPNRVVITLGERGSMYHDGSKIVFVPAKKIQVVDTTGAGDSFVAGFASSYFSNLDILQSIEKGIEVASITCQYLGAQGAYESLVKHK